MTISFSGPFKKKGKQKENSNSREKQHDHHDHEHDRGHAHAEVHGHLLNNPKREFKKLKSKTLARLLGADKDSYDYSSEYNELGDAFIVPNPEITDDFGAVHTRRRTKRPNKIVIHDSDGTEPTGRKVAKYLAGNNRRRVSTHIVIGKKKRQVWRVAPDNLVATHVSGHNDRSLGLDFANANYLGRDPVTGAKLYDPYTEPQYEDGSQQIAHWISKFHMVKDPYDPKEYEKVIQGHKHLNPNSRSDPSPAFDMKRMRKMVREKVIQQYEIAKGKRPPKKKSFLDGFS